jgi:hypothetical protein
MAGRATKVRSPGAQAPSHAGNCQTGEVGEGSLPARSQLTGPRSVGCLKGATVRGETTVLFFRDDSLRAQDVAGATPDEILCDRYRLAGPTCKAVRPYASCIWSMEKLKAIAKTNSNPTPKHKQYGKHLVITLENSASRTVLDCFYATSF